MTTQNPQALQNIMMPMIRRVMPGLIANSIIGVQPMTGPAGDVFTMRTRYTRRKRAPQPHNRNRRARLYRLWWQDRIKLMPKRRSKGHWTELRVLFGDTRYSKLGSNLRAAWREQQDDDGWGWSSDVKFWDWVNDVVSPLGGRVVYDIRFATNGLHMDSHESLVQLTLTWGGAQ